MFLFIIMLKTIYSLLVEIKVKNLYNYYSNNK
jgi:hypothetical protein